MLPYDLESSVGFWLFSTTHVYHRSLNEELSAHGITMRQWEVLVRLAGHGDMSQSDLAESMNIEAPTLVGVLDRMERDGWIQRVNDPSDRRRNLIRPTVKVAPMWANMIECAHRVRAIATQNLTEEQVAALHDTLSIMRESLEKKAAPTAGS